MTSSRTTSKAGRPRGNEAEFEAALRALRPEFALRNQMIEARLRRGWTQRQLAQRMGTTQSAIARLENGRSSPTVKTLEKMAAATGSRLVMRLD
ncbi:helix-turn-helix domain-containing protein [Acidicapsa ligni]|uniref:helix-turn-helix domain-containing protein n=1 Tax=Acidicapsa ligni TaxID=542300 RepID=UPI0021DFE43D|nr:helix-turn-helix transcriptional regulator [Acidicapsa ligni]